MYFFNCSAVDQLMASNMSQIQYYSIICILYIYIYVLYIYIYVYVFYIYICILYMSQYHPQ